MVSAPYTTTDAATAEPTAAELDTARVALFRAAGTAADDSRGMRYRVALVNLASAIDWHLSWPDHHSAARVREGRSMAAALSADDPGRVSLAIWRAEQESRAYGSPEERRGALVEMRAEKADDRGRAERHIVDGPADCREFWAGRVAAIAAELARIDATLARNLECTAEPAGGAQ